MNSRTVAIRRLSRGARRSRRADDCAAVSMAVVHHIVAKMVHVSLPARDSGAWPAWSVAQGWTGRRRVRQGRGCDVGTGSDGNRYRPVVRTTAYVTPGTLDLLGVRPLRGRTFGDDDAADGRVVVIAEALWRRGFGADPGIVGRTVRVDDTPAIVVGVLPATFRFPDQATEVWRPLAVGGRGPGAWDRPATVVRFRKDIPSDEALRLAGRIAHATDPSTVGRNGDSHRLWNAQAGMPPYNR
jgi:MacB-like protein